MAEPRITREMLEAAAQRAVAKQPDGIQLTAAPGHVWERAADVAAYSIALRNLSFSDAGTYIVNPLSVGVQFLLHSTGRMYAIVYEHAKAGVWVDLVIRYEDGTSLTVSKTRDRGLEPRPGHPVVHLPDATPELYAAATRQPADGPAKVLSPASIVVEFERAWQEGAEWRKTRGISVVEVASVLLSRDGNVRALRAGRIHFIGEQDGAPERELKSRFTRILQQHGPVGKAYLARVQHDEEPTEHVALCLTGASANRTELLAAIRAVFASVFSAGANLAILFIGPEETARLERVCQPFYDGSAT